MAAMPIYGKNPSKIFSGGYRPIALKFVLLGTLVHQSKLELEQVDGVPSHIPAPAPSHIPNGFLVLIHRAITCDSFKVLAQKAGAGVV